MARKISCSNRVDYQLSNMGYCPGLFSRLMRYLFIYVPAILFGFTAIISFLAPILEEKHYYFYSNLFYKILSNLCHQNPFRSLWLYNRPIGICSRCLAIYASFSLSLFFVRLVKEKRRIYFLIFLFFPVILDGFMQLLMLFESSNLSRVITGILFGFSASIVYKHCCCYFGGDPRLVNEYKELKPLYRFVLYMLCGIILIAVLYFGLAFLFRLIFLLGG